MRKRKWTIDQLTYAVSNSISYRQVLIKLGLKEAGGNYAQVKKYIAENKLDISHFKGKGWNLGKRGIGKPRIPLIDILENRVTIQSYKLKRRLFKEGIKTPKCEICGWTKKAKNGNIPVELDHINGDNKDNRLSNLRILCPNCHSLTDYYRGRKRT